MPLTFIFFEMQVSRRRRLFKTGAGESSKKYACVHFGVPARAGRTNRIAKLQVATWK